MSTSKKGISSTELSRMLQLQQKTSWLLQRKVKEAMKSSNTNFLEGKVIIDELIIGQHEEKARGRILIKKKLVIFAIEKKGRGVSMVYGKVIKRATAKELGEFIREKVSKNAHIITDAWSEYVSLKKEFQILTMKKSEKNEKNFSYIHKVFMGFKGWLRGIHHHAKHLQSYLDKYTCRFNRHRLKENIIDNLMNRMINSKPLPYKMIID